MSIMQKQLDVIMESACWLFFKKRIGVMGLCTVENAFFLKKVLLKYS